MSERTIEDVLNVAWPVYDLHTATEDGPVFSADGGVVVHRTDPELAESVRLVGLVLTHHPDFPGAAHNVREAIESLDRAAALLAAPVDPEEAA